MNFKETSIAGAFLVESQRREDERGFFARTFCSREFREHGLNGSVVQINVSYNEKLGTLRGLHYQVAPHAETKVVRVTRGRVFDVIVDLRPASPSYTRWFGVELDERNAHGLYVPEGLAHGFVTLAAETEVLYLMGTEYVPAAGSGVRYDDPAFAVRWPIAPSVVSNRDLEFPPFVR